MAFTQDEIQTLNSILDAKLLLLRREMQRAGNGDVRDDLEDDE